jgi:hypothetical protein
MMDRMGKSSALLLVIMGALAFGGCVRRTMTINSDPPGALVWMNDQEVGRTPLTRDFTWYGHYDVQVRKEGYQTLDTNMSVIAPFWQWPPLDLFVELLPLGLHDSRNISYNLQPATTQPANPSAMLARAAEMREHLVSSPHTRVPTTAPTTAPNTNTGATD